jgi:hypothetical protein
LKTNQQNNQKHQKPKKTKKQYRVSQKHKKANINSVWDHKKTKNKTNTNGGMVSCDGGMKKNKKITGDQGSISVMWCVGVLIHPECGEFRLSLLCVDVIVGSCWFVGWCVIRV